MPCWLGNDPVNKVACAVQVTAGRTSGMLACQPRVAIAERREANGSNRGVSPTQFNSTTLGMNQSRKVFPVRLRKTRSSVGAVTSMLRTGPTAANSFASTVANFGPVTVSMVPST